MTKWKKESNLIFRKWIDIECNLFRVNLRGPAAFLIGSFRAPRRMKCNFELAQQQLSILNFNNWNELKRNHRHSHTCRNATWSHQQHSRTTQKKVKLCAAGVMQNWWKWKMCNPQPRERRNFYEFLKAFHCRVENFLVFFHFVTRKITNSTSRKIVLKNHDDASTPHVVALPPAFFLLSTIPW